MKKVADGKWKTCSIALLAIAINLSSADFSLAYDDNTTHRALTSEIVKFFNSSYPNAKFSDEDAKAIIQGSKDEDAPGRWMRHFYDPVHQKGLTYGVEWESSKNWSTNTLGQATYQINTLANRPLYGSLLNLFGGDSDYSWERGIYEYAWGDRKRGLETLGHVLHLIEDATVPDHTRNDPHPGIGTRLKGPEAVTAFLENRNHIDSSPYESFAKFDIGSLQIAEKLAGQTPVLLASLSEHFETTAKYSNNNFFSKDTIEKNYLSPKVSKVSTIHLNQTDYFFGFMDKSEIPIVYVKKEINPKEGSIEDVYSLKDPGNYVLENYWQQLSKQAVLHGAGVVKLFFDEVEKERKTKVLYEKNRSWLTKKVDRSKDALFVLVGAIYGSSVTKADLSDEGPVERPLPPPVVKPITRDNPPALIEESLPPEAAGTVGAVIVPAPASEPPPSPQNAPTPLPATLATPPALSLGVSSPPPLGRFIGGGGAPPPASAEAVPQTAQSTAITADITPPPAPAVSTPVSGSSASTTSLAFSGTAEANSVISIDGFTNTAATDDAGSWSLTLSLNQGTSTLQFFATDGASNRSQAAAHAVFIDSQAPDITLAVEGCGTTIAATGCLLMNTAVSLNWSSSATDGVSYQVECETSGGACAGFSAASSATSTTFTASDNTSYTFRARATDTAGNSISQTQSASVYTRPVVINEVAWAGTSAARSEDEWIELYNRTSFPISLSGWVLYSETDLKPYLNLSGSIAANSYYLIERTDDSVTSVIADLIAPFGSGSGRGLSNSGETLVLSYASTSADQTPNSCSGWCGGGTSNYASMERYDPEGAGADSANWRSSNWVRNGANADNAAITATPRARNGISYLIVPPNTTTLSASKTLRQAHSPYIIAGATAIASGATLTIEPGVTVKVINSGSLTVNGILNAVGAAANPIVITSFQDDEYGGDLNGDGSASWPQVNSWDFIALNSSGSTLDYARVRYGGNYPSGPSLPPQGMFFVNGVSATVTNSTFEFFRDAGVSLHVSDGVFRDNVVQAGTTTPASNAVSVGIRVSGSPEISGNTVRNNAFGVWVMENAGTARILNNTFTANISGAVTLSNNSIRTVLGGNTASGNRPHNGVIVSGTVTQPISLSADLPYIGVFTAQNATLTIPAGAVFKGRNTISFFGMTTVPFDIRGTAAAPVVFTSLADDAYGGDTDGNGDNAALCAADPNNAVCPTRESGAQIQISGGSATSTIQSALFRFGGRVVWQLGAIHLTNGGRADISNTTFEHGHAGLEINSGSTARVDASIVRDNAYGIENRGTLTLSNTIFRDNTNALISTGAFTDSGGNDIDSSNTTRASPSNLLP